MDWKPLQDYVIVRRHAPKTRTEGGIYLPDTSHYKENIGTIVAIGDGKHKPDGTGRYEMPVSIGEVVYFEQYAGKELFTDDADYLILRALDDIIGVERP